MLGKTSQHLLPNGSFMVMNPTVESVKKSPTKQIQVVALNYIGYTYIYIYILCSFKFKKHMFFSPFLVGCYTSISHPPKLGSLWSPRVPLHDVKLGGNS